MIIDSNAHCNNNTYKKPFRYLTYSADGYALKEGDWERLFRELQEAGMRCKQAKLIVGMLKVAENIISS